MPYSDPQKLIEYRRRKQAAMTREERDKFNERARQRRASNKHKSQEYTKQNYHKRRNQLIEQMGGKCVRCGNTEELEFDHIDKHTKTAKVTSLLASSSLQSAIDEAQKCQLLCRQCHIKKTNECKDNIPGV